MNGAREKTERGTQRRFPLSGHHSTEEEEKTLRFSTLKKTKLYGFEQMYRRGRHTVNELQRNSQQETIYKAV